MTYCKNAGIFENIINNLISDFGFNAESEEMEGDKNNGDTKEN